MHHEVKHGRTTGDLFLQRLRTAPAAEGRHAGRIILHVVAAGERQRPDRQAGGRHVDVAAGRVRRSVVV